MLKVKVIPLMLLYIICHNVKRIQQSPCQCILTDICPARRGQSKAFSFSTSSSGISWLTVNMLPTRFAWRWGKRPEQWLPENKRPRIKYLFHGGIYFKVKNFFFFFKANKWYKTSTIKSTFLPWLVAQCNCSADLSPSTLKVFSQ